MATDLGIELGQEGRVVVVLHLHQRNWEHEPSARGAIVPACHILSPNLYPGGANVAALTALPFFFWTSPVLDQSCP